METILIEVPVQLKSAVETMVETTLKSVKLARSGRTLDTMAAEGIVRAGTRECERSAMQMIVEAAVVDAPRVRVNGQVLFSVGKFEAEYMTAAGPVRVERPLYREVRNGPTFDVLGMKLGVVDDRWLPGAAAQMGLLLARGTSREAEHIAQALGRLPYSRSSFERVGHSIGELYVRRNTEIDQLLIEEFEVPEDAAGIVVSLDRVSVPMEEPRSPGQTKESAAKRPISRNYRMAYCAALSLVDGEGNALHTIRYGSMAEYGPIELVDGLASDVLALLDKGRFKVMLNADGAPELWNLLDSAINPESVGVEVHRLIDMFHLLEKLGTAAAALHGEQEGRAVTARWRLLLYNSSKAALTILDDLVASARRDKPVHDAITYIENNHDRMDYATALRDGLPVGSGPVEATCKSLVALRMKRPGSRWKETTGQHIIQLRALLLSDRWQPAMDHILKPLRRPVRAVA